MIKVSVDGKIDIPASTLWSWLTNIKDYPRRVKYVKSVDISGPLALGKEWSDWNSLLWIPTRVKHKTTKMVKEEELAFAVSLPAGGKMYQTIFLMGDGGKTRARGEISFDLGNPLANFLFGPVLRWRLTDMLTSTLKKAQGGLNEN